MLCYLSLLLRVSLTSAARWTLCSAPFLISFSLCQTLPTLYLCNTFSFLLILCPVIRARECVICIIWISLICHSGGDGEGSRSPASLMVERALQEKQLLHWPHGLPDGMGEGFKKEISDATVLFTPVRKVSQHKHVPRIQAPASVVLFSHSQQPRRWTWKPIPD